MNFQYIKNLINDIKELASSQMIIVILLFAQVSIVTKGLGTIKYGQAVLVLALVAIIFRSLHARNSDVTLLMIQKLLNIKNNKLFQLINQRTKIVCTFFHHIFVSLVKLHHYFWHEDF